MNNKVIPLAIKIMREDFLIKLGILVKRCINSPYTVTLSITDQCNAQCTTCTRWQTGNEIQELSCDEWQQLIVQMNYWLKPCYISFTGGEPFVKEWFCDLLKFAHKLGVYSNVSTNGIFFTPENYDKITQTGVDFILISLNSLDPEIHNTYKGVKNLHQRIVSAIKYMKNNSKVRIGVSCIITRDNYRQLSDFASWAHNLGVDSINFQVIRDTFGPNFSAHPSIIASSSNPYWKIDDLTELDRQLDLLMRQKNNGVPIVTPGYDLNIFKKYFRDPLSIPRKLRCSVGFRNLIISSTGDVKLCYMFETLGNVKEEEIKDIWFSGNAQKQRMEMLKCGLPCVSACLREFKLSDQIKNFFTRLALR